MGAEQQGVQAKLDAVAQIGAAVSSFARQAGQAGDQATASAQEVERRVIDEHGRRVDQLKRAKAAREAAATALRACEENCGPLERALAEAQRAEALAVARADASAKAVAQIGEALAAFATARRSFAATLESHASRAIESTRQLSTQLQEYLAPSAATTMSGAPGNSSRANANPSASAGPGSSLEEIDVAKIVDDRTSALSFEKVSHDHVVWGLESLKAVVEPGVKMGKGPDYFKQRDTSEGLSGERSYSGVYNWFYNSDHAIKVVRASNGYVVSNGYHRLAVARELGIASLPAQVR